MDIPAYDMTSPSHCDETRWYVVQTQPHGESKSVVNLIQQGFSVFCPHIRKTVRHARKVTEQMSALFPGYVFVSMNVARTRWRAINGTFGVSRLLVQDDCPLPVPHGVVETLMAHSDEAGILDGNCGLQVGQSVRLTDGPFAELTGRLAYLDAKGRVHVLLDMMGRQVRISSQAERLVPAV